MTETATATTTTTTTFCWYMTRGPLAVMVAVLSLVFPFLHNYGLKLWNDGCSTSILFHLLLFILGIYWSLYDVYNILQSSVRLVCANWLNTIVLDDILKSIYDPETGWIACLTGALVGTSTMYGLKMTKEQRCRLVQSSLGLPNQQMAHSVLLEPGGWKAILLPLPIQKWLQQQQQSEMMETATGGPNLHKKLPQKMKSKTYRSCSGFLSNPGDVSIDTISTYCDGMEVDHYHDQHDEDIDFEGETVQRARGLSFHYEEDSPSPNDNENEKTTPQLHQRKERHNNNTSSSSTSSIPEQHPPAQNPMKVFATILKDIAHEQFIQPYANAFPQSTVENVGIAAIATSLAIHLLLGNRRSSSSSSQRHMMRMTMGRVITYTALSSVAMISFGSIFTREVILGNIHDQQSMKLVCREMLSRIVNKIKRNVLSNKTKSFLAMVILLLLRKKPQTISPSGR